MAGGAKMGTGTSAGSGSTPGVASVGTNTGAQLGVTSATLNSGSSASGLRKRGSPSGTGALLGVPWHCSRVLALPVVL